MEFETVSLKKLGKIVTGRTPSTKKVNKPFCDFSQIPFLTPKDMQGDRIVWKTERYLTKDGYESVKAITVPKNSISVSCIGSDLGKVVLNAGDSVTNQQINTIIPFSDKVNFLYLYYVLSLKQQYFKSIASGSATPILNKSTFSEITVQIPSLEIQNKVVVILDPIDKKIELNNQINETLEAMAQALFKSWFIDFEPVKAKMEAKDAGADETEILLEAMSAISGKDLEALKILQTTAPEEYAELKAIAEQFPDSLEESELGMIPKGWEVVIAEDLYEITIGRTPPRKEKQWFSLNDHDIKWLSIKDLGQNGIYIMQTNEKLTYEAIEKFRINVLPQNTVFLSFKMTIGRVGIANERMCTNEAIAHFVPLDEIPYEWTYLYLTHFNYDSLGSTSSIATAINSKIIRQMRLLMPTSNLLEIFRLKISYIFQKIRSIGIENQTLTELRDTLLPKLLSGEIDVSNVEIDELLENEA